MTDYLEDERATLWYKIGELTVRPMPEFIDVEYEDGERGISVLSREISNMTSCSGAPVKLWRPAKGATDDGWAEWNGGDRPVDGDAMVEVVLRDDSKSEMNANSLTWLHTGDNGDIIRYRVVKGSMADEEVKLGKAINQEAARLFKEASSLDVQEGKQSRYQDDKGDDWIDECARTFTPEEFRGAMKFSMGKYQRRYGKKDDRLMEAKKIADYANRLVEYEANLKKA